MQKNPCLPDNRKTLTMHFPHEYLKTQFQRLAGQVPKLEERKKEALRGWAKATGNWHTSVFDFTDKKISLLSLKLVTSDTN